MNITNKTILITGANRGIGLALVQEALSGVGLRAEAVQVQFGLQRL